MNYSVYRVSLDIHDVGASFALNLKSEDTQRQIHATLMEKGSPYEITEDVSADIATKLPDGSVVKEGCTIKDNVIIYEMSEQVSAVSGKATCEFILTDTSGHRLTTPGFCLIISPNIGGEQA